MWNMGCPNAPVWTLYFLCQSYRPNARCQNRFFFLCVSGACIKIWCKYLPVCPMLVPNCGANCSVLPTLQPEFGASALVRPRLAPNSEQIGSVCPMYWQSHVFFQSSRRGGSGVGTAVWWLPAARGQPSGVYLLSSESGRGRRRTPFFKFRPWKGRGSYSFSENT